jgi:hypothetical protein
VSIDGPYVEILEGQGVAEAPAFSPLEAVRAFDSAGRQLARAVYSRSRFEGGRSWRGLAFKGPVARVDVDSVARWADVDIRYDVPIAPLLPESRMGTAPRDERDVAADPDARVEIGVQESGGGPPAAPADDGSGRVPIPPRDQLSETAGRLADGLDALAAELPAAPAVVQLLMSAPARVSISVQTAGSVQQWTWNDGELSGPREVNTRWLECKAGMPADALTLQRVPAIWDDAIRRVGGGAPLQLVVGQYPCGIPHINVPFEAGRRVQYEADGRFATLE